MTEMVSYIFSSLRDSERAIKVLSKNAILQNKFNTAMLVVGACVITHMVITDLQLSEQQKKIEALTKEVEELKDTKKGE